MTSSTKPEAHNVSHCRQWRTEPRTQATCRKFGKIWKTCAFWDIGGYINIDKWSKKFDEGPHRRRGNFSRRTMSYDTDSIAVRCSSGAVMSLLILFAAYNATVTHKCFSIGRKTSKNAPSHWGVGPPNLASNRHLDRFSRFAELTNVTNRQTSRPRYSVSINWPQRWSVPFLHLQNVFASVYNFAARGRR